MQRYGEPRPMRVGKVALSRNLTRRAPMPLTPQNAARLGLSAALTTTIVAPHLPQVAEGVQQAAAIVQPVGDAATKAAGTMTQPVVDAVVASAGAVKDYFTLPEFRESSERESMFGATIEFRLEKGKIVPVAPAHEAIRNIPPKARVVKGTLQRPAGITTEKVAGDHKDITIRVGLPSETAPQLTSPDEIDAAMKNGHYFKVVLGEIQKPDDESGTLLVRPKDPSIKPYEFNKWLVFVNVDGNPIDPRTGQVTTAPDGTGERFYISARQVDPEEIVPLRPIPLV